jgi:hypothetical protein
VKRAVLARLGAVLGACLTVTAPSFGAVTFELVNADAPGEGLNDPTPVLPEGGNPATTVGEARRRVLAQVFSQVGCHLDSVVPVKVSVHFDPLLCTIDSAVLANAGPWQASRNFPGAPLSNTFYPVALANARAGVDLDAANPDVFMNFNAGLGGSNCVPGAGWYYGIDGNASPLDFDMFTLAMHELMHGLGFLTFENVSTGEKLFGSNDAYIVNLQVVNGVPSSYVAMTDAQRATANRSEPNLRWAGANLVAAYGAPSALFAPSTLIDGSSVNHLSRSQFPTELMSPYYLGPQHELGRTLPILADEGWGVHTQCVPSAPAPALPFWGVALLGGMLMAGAVGAQRRRS